MATAQVLVPHDIPTTLNYYAPVGEEAPYQYVNDPPEGKPQTNIGSDPHPVVIHDARGKESSVSLDTSGFQFVRHVSAEKEFEDEEAIKTTYYKEVEDLLKKEAGAKRIFIFDHTIRSAYKPARCRCKCNLHTDASQLTSAMESSPVVLRRPFGDQWWVAWLIQLVRI